MKKSAEKIKRADGSLAVWLLILTAMCLVGGVETGSVDYGKGSVIALVCAVIAFFRTK